MLTAVNTEYVQRTQGTYRVMTRYLQRYIKDALRVVIVYLEGDVQDF